MSTTSYQINRSPSVPLNNRIVEEEWTGKEVNLSHLRVFGCVAYAHVSFADRSKLDAILLSAHLLVMVVMNLVTDSGMRITERLFVVEMFSMNRGSVQEHNGDIKF